MAIFLSERDEAREAYEKGELEKGTLIPEFEQEEDEED
jgi:hypothetical protein